MKAHTHTHHISLRLSRFRAHWVWPQYTHTNTYKHTIHTRSESVCTCSRNVHARWVRIHMENMVRCLVLFTMLLECGTVVHLPYFLYCDCSLCLDSLSHLLNAFLNVPLYSSFSDTNSFLLMLLEELLLFWLVISCSFFSLSLSRFCFSLFSRIHFLVCAWFSHCTAFDQVHFVYRIQICVDALKMAELSPSSWNGNNVSPFFHALTFI